MPSRIYTTMFTPKLSTVFASLVFTAAFCFGSVSAQESEAFAAAAPPTCPLDVAFEAVSKMPLRPHVKTRSRLQEELVQAVLQEGRLAEAISWTAEIDNWRRGLALAHIAVHHANAGARAAALQAIADAEAFEKTITSEDEQGWRRDRVRVRIAEAYALIGEPAKAAQIQASATPSEGGRLAPMAVRTVADADVSKQLATLETIAKTGDLEQVRFALLAMAELYGRALKSPSGDEATPSPDALEGRIKAAWGELPIEPRIDVVERLIQFDVEAGEAGAIRAAAHCEEISRLVTDHRWNLEQAIGLRARVAGLFESTGDVKAGRSMADDALALYGTSGASIVSIYRGEALRPLAEAFVALGDAATATMIYERALEAALENPNSRPRATDLARTAISVSVASSGSLSSGQGYKAPKTLLRAFERASKAVGAPW